jgi:hypothetical protein
MSATLKREYKKDGVSEAHKLLRFDSRSSFRHAMRLPSLLLVASVACRSAQADTRPKTDFQLAYVGRSAVTQSGVEQELCSAGEDYPIPDDGVFDVRNSKGKSMYLDKDAWTVVRSDSSGVVAMKSSKQSRRTLWIDFDSGSKAQILTTSRCDSPCEVFQHFDVRK